MAKKILIATGGTGGHLFPAQGLGQQLVALDASHDILFVGCGLGSSRYFDTSKFPYREISSAPFRFENPLKIVSGMGKLAKGVWQSRRLIQEFQPDVVVGFGSYHTIPSLLAAKWKNIPIILHESNSVPGKANRWFAPYAHTVGVHFPFAATCMRGNIVEVATPLREGYRLDSVSSGAARSYFGLEQDRLTLLVFGGSQGALAINQCVKECFEQGVCQSIQVIHLIGEKSNINELSELYAKKGILACVKPFESAMQMAWQAADLFIGRSGAATIAEATEFEVPGILIPYPFATENHQEKNADFYVEQVGGGVKLLQANLTADKLRDTLVRILDTSVMNNHRNAIRKYKSRPSCRDLCTLVLEVA